MAPGCGQTSQNPQSMQPPTSEAGSAGRADEPMGGSSLLPVGGSSAASNGGGSGGASGSAAATAGGAAADDAGGAPSAGSEATGGSGPDDPDAVKPALGCGKPATQALGEFVKYTLLTSGVKDAQCADSLNGVPKCGPWSVERDYFVWLPPDYDPHKAYPLVIQGTGCGGIGNQVYSLSTTNTGAGVDGSVIRVGLSPPPVSIGHGTNPNQGCYDDKEGDDSVDFVFYERLLDELRGELCFDQNRVYASGTSSGSWLANELACKYAGNQAGYAIRAVATNEGGLPTEPQFAPTCSQAPLAGLWVRLAGDLGGGFDATKFAIARAMKVNGCANTDYDSAVALKQVENFPIGDGNADDTCQRILGCGDSNPLVVCTVQANGHGGHDWVANPAFSTFFKKLAAHE